MMSLFDANKRKVKSFNSYGELFVCLNHIEKQKLFNNIPEFWELTWSFSIQSPEQVAVLYNNTRKHYDLSKMKEAFTKEIPLLEICKGDYKDLVQIPLIPSVDVAELRKNWCQEYCKEHQLYLSETLEQTEQD